MSFLFYSLTKTKMRKKIKKMLWRVATTASAATAALVLIGVLLVQASMGGAGNYGKAYVGADFGEIQGNEWVQNDAGQWVANGNANPSSYNGDLSSFMVLGDSISFGYMVGYTPQPVDPSLVTHTWPKLVADQAGVNLDVPFYSQLPDNLAVPGYTLGDMSTLYSALLAKNSLTQLVMGFYNYIYGDQTPVDYVLAENPTAVGVMIGNNDVLGAATNANVHLKTPVQYFQYLYSDMVSKLAADPERAVVVSTIPDVSAIPFLMPATDVTPFPQAIPVINYADNTPYTLTANDYISLAGIAKLNAQALPLVKCPGLNEAPNFACSGDVLTQAEVDAISAHTDAFNIAIRTIASQYNNVAVMNFDEVFDKLKENGIVIKGARYTLEYGGGLVSLDGVHPTKLGHGVLANEMIKTLNTNFATGIQPIVLHDIAANEVLAIDALTPPVALNAKAIENTQDIMNPNK